MIGRCVGAVLLVALAGAAAGGAGIAAEAGEKPAPQAGALAPEPYVGIRVRDTGDGPVVAWILPGPAGGDGTGSAIGLRRGDNVEAVYRGVQDIAEHRVAVTTAAAFNEFIDLLRPGEAISIEARRSPEAVHDGAMPKGGPGGDVVTYTITVGDRDDWTGTVGRGLGDRTIPPANEGEFESLVLGLAAEVGVREADGGLDALLPYLAGVQDSNLDPNSLPAVVRAFRRPLSVDAVEGEIAVLARAAAGGDFDAITALIGAVLDVPDYSAIRGELETLKFDAAQLRDDARGLVAWSRSNVSVGGEGARSQIRAIRASERVLEPLLAFQLHAIDAMTKWEALGRIRAGGPPLAELPDAIAAAVTGEILYVHEFPNGTVGVVGGPGPNTYDMSVVTDVYDAGGDDRYTFAMADDALAGGNHHVIDIAGDDTYEAASDFAGPGVGVLGVSIVDDRDGDDTYRSAGQFSIGAGLYGVGLLIDHAGDDRYENLGPGSGWSMGVGYYGAGLVIDRDGGDTYHGEQLTQGVGGPRGFGAVIDSSGDDSYKANGPSFGSVYRTDGVFKGFSQGFGIGVRSYAAGGLGAIYDLSGNDRYEAGEFSQACAYYFAMGVLHDGAGDDEYVGNRYGQASAAHQAIGLLIDDGGDDRYWSMTAASQAGVWDQSVAMLIDRAGDDSYEADGLAQGSASMQALGVLLDLDGVDAYSAKGAARHGQSGSNAYHYDADRIFSFSALIDLGGDADAHGPERADGTTVATGALDEGDPGASPLHGLFADP